MKKNVFFIKMLVICSILFSVSCTENTDTLDASEDSTMYNMEAQDIVARKAGGVKTMKVLIEYVKGTSKYRKEKIRKNYISTGMLLNWEYCDIKDVEVWEVDIKLYYSKDGMANSSTDDEDVSRKWEYAECIDYRGRE